MHIGRPLALALLTLAACKGDAAKSRSEKAAKGNDFWPEAPKATKSDRARKLAYNPENVKGYTLGIDVGSLAGADLSITAKMTLGLAFAPGESPRDRVAKLSALDFDVNAAGQKMAMKLSGDTLTVDDGSGTPTTITRGQEGPLSLEAIVDKPFTTLTFGEDNKITAKGNPDHLFTDSGGDFLDTALVLFPDLPAGEIKPGHTWSVKRNVALGNNLGRVDVTYDFEYVGDGACPSGGTDCAQLAFTASSTDATAIANGVEVKVGYGFAGKVFFDVPKGVIDESRIRMDMDVKADKYKLPMGGTYTLKPT